MASCFTKVTCPPTSVGFTKAVGVGNRIRPDAYSARAPRMLLH